MSCHFSSWVLGVLALASLGASADVVINELDSNQAGPDTAEFVELYDGGIGGTPLDGLSLVYFNGNSDLSYLTVDLDGFETDTNGYFLVGNSGVSTAPDIQLPDDTLQNGADAVALYAAPAAAFPDGSAITIANLLSAVVYGSGQSDDPELLALVTPDSPQLNEGSGAQGEALSLQRCPDGEGVATATVNFARGVPTPGGPNNCPQETARVLINEIDSNQTGDDTAEFVELFDGGAGNTALDGLVLVFYNGASDSVYLSLDLDGLTTSADGYFTVGGRDAEPDVLLTDSTIQNGADAVALYAADSDDFPGGTGITLEGLRDAVVYGIDDADDAELLALVGGVGPMLDEGTGGDSGVVSLQRCPNGEGLPATLSGFVVDAPTARLLNTCPDGLVVAEFSFDPVVVYVGELVDFTDESTGTPDAWAWDFGSGEPATSAEASPQNVVFNTPGDVAISLTASSGLGADIETKTIRVLSREPEVEGVRLSSETVAPCDTVRLGAFNPTGQPPLAFTWSVRNESNAEVFAASGSTIDWEVPGVQEPGSYTAVLTVTNVLGSVESSTLIGVQSIRPNIELSTTTPSPTTQPQVPVTVAFESVDILTGFGAEDFLLTNATLLSLEQGDDVYTGVFAFNGEGQATIGVGENAGTILCGVPNRASNTLTFLFDPTAPTPLLVPQGPLVSASPLFSLAIVFGEPVTGLTEDDLLVENGTVTDLTGSDATYSANVVATALGDLNVRLRAGAVTDTAGNASPESAPLAFRYRDTYFSHSADVNSDGAIELSELLRVVQFYNAGALQCSVETEDGFTLGTGDQTCVPHTGDYAPTDWAVSLSELLRLVQLYASGTYYECTGTEDGYCIGTLPGR
jgi:PKD repeat protein